MKPGRVLWLLQRFGSVVAIATAAASVIAASAIAVVSAIAAFVVVATAIAAVSAIAASAIAASAVATSEEAAGFVEEDEATMAHAMVDVVLELVMMICRKILTVVIVVICRITIVVCRNCRNYDSRLS